MSDMVTWPNWQYELKKRGGPRRYARSLSTWVAQEKNLVTQGINNV
jgi:hypothetical protein